MTRLRYRLALTPAGAGVATVVFPGLLVALAGGQRALLAVSVGSALALAVNGVWAAASLRGVQVRLRSPATATVDQPVPVRLAVDAPAGRELVVGVADGVRPWVRTGDRAEGEVGWRPARRGVVGGLDVRVRSSRPLGLVVVARHGIVALDPAVHVAPPALPVLIPPVGGSRGPARPVPGGAGRGSVAGPVAGPGTGAGGSGWWTPSGGLAEAPEPVGLRAYRPGDTGRDVHWVTLARTGALLVRDRRAADHPVDVAVVVDTGAGHGVPVGAGAAPADRAPSAEARTDDILGRARSVTEELVRLGHRVVLTTWERPWDGPGPTGTDPGTLRRVTAPVTAGPDLLRRLARAAGPGALVADGAAVQAGAEPPLAGGDGVEWVGARPTGPIRVAADLVALEGAAAYGVDGDGAVLAVDERGIRWLNSR